MNKRREKVIFSEKNVEGCENRRIAEELLEKIEEQRYMLYIIARNKNLIDLEVVQMSQKLDELLNEYHHYMTEE